MARLPPFKAWFAKWKGADPATESAGLDDVSESAQIGLWGEQIAADALKQKGMKIVGRRVKLHRDEIDILAICSIRGTEMLVFVEVKTRGSLRFGGGRAAMDKRKRHALCRAAAHYLRKLPKTPFRFDLVEVIGSRTSPTPPVIRHFENAFPMELRYLHTGLHR
jgi:putative endonuclease